MAQQVSAFDAQFLNFETATNLAHIAALTILDPSGRPGGDHKLAVQVARLHGARLDRGRPLWEMYLIHGLAGGRVGIYTKVHHAAVDGVTGAEVLAAVMDFEPEPAAVPAPEAAPEPQPA